LSQAQRLRARLDHQRLPHETKRMLFGGSGPLGSFVVLIFLPVLGAAFLSRAQFAMWVILSSVATISVAVDFGGTSLVSSFLLVSDRPMTILRRGALLSSAGTILVGLGAVLLWIPYSHGHTPPGWSFSEGLWSIVLSAFASVLRSILNVLSAAYLAIADYRSRNRLTTGSALATLVVALVLLIVLRSAWALPAAWTIGSLVALGSVTRRLRRLHADVVPHATPTTRKVAVSSYSAYRTVASILGSVLLQGDRWVVGAVAGSTFLAGYEIAWRIASLPRLVNQAITNSVIPDTAVAVANGGVKPVSALYRKSMRTSLIASVIVVGISIPMFAVAFYLYLSVGSLICGLLLLIALTVQGLTANLTAVALGAGIGKGDLPYLASSMLIIATAWTLGLLRHSLGVAFGGEIIGLLSCYSIYLTRADRLIRKWVLAPVPRLYDGRHYATQGVARNG
jgi:O-antigen/teichoic acid export membrane protein